MSGAGQHHAEMRVTVLKEIPDDLMLARDWNRLVEHMEHPEVFFTYEWALAAARAFQATLTPLLFLMYEADELCGVAPMATNKEGGATASFLTAGTADYCDIVSTPQARGAVLACLLQNVRKLDLGHLSLSRLPSDSLTWKELPPVSRARGFHLAWRPAEECGLVEFGSEEHRAKMLRTVTRRNREERGFKRLSKRGSVQITHLVNPGESDRCLSQFISAQVSRFLATGRISTLIRLEYRIFLKELAALLSVRGWLKISQLEVNGEPVAWQYGFRFGYVWFWYLPSFKIDYEDCSPGSCLMRLLIAEGCADPSLRELDLGLGNESYKRDFATTVRRTYRAELSCSLSRHIRITAWNLLKAGAARYPQSAGRLKQAQKLISKIMSKWARRLHSEGLSATLAYTAKRAARLVVSPEESLFFEAPVTDNPGTSNTCLERLTLDNLADAAIADADDADTLQYLLGSMHLIKERKTRGFVLRDPERQAVHFLFVADLEGFHVGEINYTIKGVDPQDVLIFNCWTPARYRGHGYYPLAIRWAAAELLENQRTVWIGCQATNRPSMRGILKAGFAYRYSLVRHRRLGRSTVSRWDRTDALAQFSR